jgi:hypothetical protein
MTSISQQLLEFWRKSVLFQDLLISAGQQARAAVYDRVAAAEAEGRVMAEAELALENSKWAEDVVCLPFQQKLQLLLATRPVILSQAARGGTPSMSRSATDHSFMSSAASSNSLGGGAGGGGGSGGGGGNKHSQDEHDRMTDDEEQSMSDAPGGGGRGGGPGHGRSRAGAGEFEVGGRCGVPARPAEAAVAAGHPARHPESGGARRGTVHVAQRHRPLLHVVGGVHQQSRRQCGWRRR